MFNKSFPVRFMYAWSASVTGWPALIHAIPVSMVMSMSPFPSISSSNPVCRFLASWNILRVFSLHTCRSNTAPTAVSLSDNEASSWYASIALMQSIFSLTQRNEDSSDGACSPSTARVHRIPCEFRFLHQVTAVLRSGRAHLPELSVMVYFLSVPEKGKTQLADEGTIFARERRMIWPGIFNRIGAMISFLSCF